MISYPEDGVPAHGTTREVAPGVYWLQMPLPMALNHINLYLLEDDDGWWVIDTGFGMGPTESLWEQVFSDCLGGKPVKAVIATHHHPDHIGMAGWLCERWQVPFYMTREEYLSGLTFSRLEQHHFSWTSEQHLRRCGYSQEQVERARDRFGGFGDYIKPMPGAYRRLREGDSFRINGHRWQVLVGSGHSPEHACLYCESLNVLLSGDQVIPRITSNVSVSGMEPEANPLRDWLETLERFQQLLPADTLVLPAHNEPFHGLHYRLSYLVEHHEEHLLALEQACLRETPSALELLPVLFKRELDEMHLGLAVGECVAHLNYLVQRGRLERSEDQNGCFRYRSIDDTLAMRLHRQPARAQADAPVQV